MYLEAKYMILVAWRPTYLDFLFALPLFDQLFFNARPSPPLQRRRLLTSSSSHYCIIHIRIRETRPPPQLPQRSRYVWILPTRSKSVNDEAHTSPKKSLVWSLRWRQKHQGREWIFLSFHGQFRHTHVPRHMYSMWGGVEAIYTLYMYCTVHTWYTELIQEEKAKGNKEKKKQKKKPTDYKTGQKC